MGRSKKNQPSAKDEEGSSNDDDVVSNSDNVMEDEPLQGTSDEKVVDVEDSISSDSEQEDNENEDRDDDDDKTEVVENAALVAQEAKENSSVKFSDFQLEPRVLQAIKTILEYDEPTPVQAAAIPIALNENRDVVARAKTGSGKTGAYLIPIIHRILKEEKGGDNDEGVKALILVPSRELADQVLSMVKQLTSYCGRQVNAINLAQPVSDQVQRSLLAEGPQIVIATPSRALAQLNGKVLDVNHLQSLVIDEADLISSYGYGDDLQHLSKRIPESVQTWLMSATISPEVDSLKKVFCKRAAILKLDDTSDDNGGDGEKDKLMQYYVKCNEFDKFLLAYVIFKLQLIKGKTIIFVNDIDRGYRLRLFFEQFGIRACILNSELPVNSRLHILEEFNKGVYNLLIATDETYTADDDDNNNNDNKSKKRKRSSVRDREFGVSRGVDFRDISCVLNFDLPTTSKSYTHRIGRTARAGKSGTSMSFVVSRSEWSKHKPSMSLTARKDEKVLARIIKDQGKLGRQVHQYQFNMDQVDAFRYRVEDAFRAVTRTAIREARTLELRNEMLTSEKLKRHFEDNPDDLAQLRHDKELHTARIQHHLKHVPDYLLPKKAGTNSTSQGSLGPIVFRKSSDNRIRRARNAKSKRSGGGGITKNRKMDPLKSFRGKAKK